MVLDQKWVVNSISDLKIEFGHIWSLNATIFEPVDKNVFPTFRKHFEALNATICWSVLCKLLTIEKYGVSAFTGKKINVIRPKLIENERNEVLNFFTFSKKNPFFSNFENPLKKTAPRAVFFEKMIQFQNGLKSFQIIF